MLEKELKITKKKGTVRSKNNDMKYYTTNTNINNSTENITINKQLSTDSATLNQFDTIDFTNNDIRKLDGFPVLPKLKTLYFANNHIG